MTMKKITSYMTAMLFVLALATVASAGNGITDMTGGAYDRFDIAPVADVNSVEGVSAGGLRDDKVLENGLTDFKGGAYDTFEIDAAAGKWMAGESAGGLRQGELKLSNGVTDFAGSTHDRGDIGI
jgi:hypothetical protein